MSTTPIFKVASAGGGAGDVVGPGSSTDNAIARFDGATGKLLQNSAVTIDDEGNVLLSGTDFDTGYIGFSTDARFFRGGAGWIRAHTGATEAAISGSTIHGFGLVMAGGTSPTDFSGNGASLSSAGVTLQDDTTIVWKDGILTGTSDTGLARSAAGVVKVTDGSTGIGKILEARLVEANTAGSGAPNVLTAVESHTALTNEGATAENYHTLPAAVAGLVFTFVVQDTDGIRITAAGDTIRPIAGTAASAAAGFIRCATAGAFITLLAINATEWIAIGSAGTWTIDV